MPFHIVISAVFLAALTFASVSCTDIEPPPARTSAPSATLAPTSTPTQTSLSTRMPAAVTVSAPTPAPIAAQVPAHTVRQPKSVPTNAPTQTTTSISVPTQNPPPTPVPDAATVSAPTPAPIPTPVPVPTETAQSASAPTYLAEEIPPCTPVPGPSVDPCEPRRERDQTTKSDGLILAEAPVRVEDILNGNPTTPIYTTHIVLRGTYIPGTVRCTSGHSRRYPSYVGHQSYGLLIYCFVDVRVNTYLLGTGPSSLTVIRKFSLYQSVYGYGGDDEDYGLEQLESRRLAHERALAEGGRFEYDEPLRGYLPPSGLSAAGPPSGIGGREVVMFIRPSSSLSVETWEVNYTWDVERREDGTVVAIHPFNESLEMELSALTQAITTAHQARVAANGGRIGADEGLPMLETDANRLRQYFSEPKVGAYAPGVPTPAPPPPPCGLAVPDQADNPGLMRDCINLLAAKDTLRGTATLNWSVDTPISDWDGVRVEGSPGRVTRLILVSEGLTGTLPPELARLDGLELLWLNHNQLSGEIPAELASLDGLKDLILNNNRLSGEVPEELGDLASLEVLWLNKNLLSGEVLAELANLVNLRDLLLSTNRLSGEVPAELGDLASLETLWLGGNQLTGEIPSELAGLTNLQDLSLRRNGLTGEVPAELGNLANLNRLRLARNQLTGCIPPALRNVDDHDLDRLGLQDCATP